jgi:hypothetical protein
MLRKFKVIKEEEFVKNFSSDRSHMKKNGEWLAPPPSYPPIVLEGMYTAT